MSLFGSMTPAQNPPSGGGGLFGSAQPSGGLFGQPSSTQQQPAPAAGTGLFGSAQPSGGGLFGGTTMQQLPGGLFGQQQQQQQQPQQSAGSLFGQPQQQGGGGLFGGSQPQQATAGGPFGLSQQQGGGLFGQPQQPQQQQPGGSLFGQQPQGGSLFGQSRPTGFGGNALGMSGMNQSQMQLMPPQGPNAIIEKIQRVKNSWDPAHSDYAFRSYFYNSVGEERASQIQRSPNEDVTAWEKAWAERPNKACAPVVANGFSDLDKRVTVQAALIQEFRARLWEVQEKLNAIQSRHDLSISIKLEDCRRRHQALSKRALSLAARVQVLKNRGYALQPEEEQLKKRLEGLTRLVQDPATSGRMNEVWARMMVVSEKAKAMEESLGKVEIVWDEKQLQTTGKLLQTNAAGLEFLHKEVRDIEQSFADWEEAQKSRPPRGL